MADEQSIHDLTLTELRGKVAGLRATIDQAAPFVQIHLHHIRELGDADVSVIAEAIGREPLAHLIRMTANYTFLSMELQRLSLQLAEREAYEGDSQSGSDAGG